MTDLEKYLYQLRRIEEHREVAAEKEIRKIYKKTLKELQNYLADIYSKYSVDDILTYGELARVGMDARFLEEVELRLNGITPEVSRTINETVTQTYEACYNGMTAAVTKAAGNREALLRAFATVAAVTPDIIKQAVNNPIAGLTLKDTLEKHRKDIIYNIKREIGVGLSNGDRFTTMAKRISSSLDGDYTKAVRIVRTEAHRCRESGYNDAATALNDTLAQGNSGYVMAKTWRTMQDERVRPNTVYRTKKGWKQGKKSKYNHEKMDGVTIPQDELFELPSGAKCKCPSQTGVAGEDINCRCYLSYSLAKVSELTVKKEQKKDYDNISVKDWFLNKNFNSNERYIIQNASMGGELKVLKETEKAIQIKANSDFGSFTFWCPKSCLNTEKDMKEKASKLVAGLSYNETLVNFAKEKGIKGVRKGMKTDTLMQKIKAAGYVVPER